jgi:hypothetical protein
MVKTVLFLVISVNFSSVAARFGLGWPGSPTQPETPLPSRIVYNPPIDYGENDGVTAEIEELLRKYAPVIYLQ